MVPYRWTVERIGPCGFPVNPLECPEAVCRRYLPHGRRQGRYRVAGDLHGAKGRSLFVRLRPPGPPGRWTDAATGEHGDLLDLIGHRIGAGSLGPALDEVRAFLALPAPERRDPESDRAHPPAAWDAAAAARRLWRTCRPLGGTHAERYLRARGLNDCRLPALRFHPALAYRDDSGRRRWPCGSPCSSTPDRERSPRRPWYATARDKCHNRPMRFFNTEGPVRPDDHYAIQPLDRMDVDELLGLIRAKRYFVLHAPRQTGKTSALIALRDLLNSGAVGDFRCVHTNVEVGQVARDDTARGIRAILSRLAMRARLLHDDFPHESWRAVLEASGPDDALGDLLSNWCLANPTPLVLLVDEIDSLVGDTLLSVLRQLRAGYEQRPEGFPQSVVLCGVRDIRDYRIRSSTGEVIAGGSPFNVAAKSLRMGDFTEAETRALMAQHTEETGQRFTAAAVDSVWTQSCGQPWLVNALCAGACFDNKAGRDRSRTIEVDDVYAAREELILARRTHLDQLAHKLEEERVRRVVEPMLSGGRRGTMPATSNTFATWACWRRTRRRASRTRFTARWCRGSWATCCRTAWTSTRDGTWTTMAV